MVGSGGTRYFWRDESPSERIYFHICIIGFSREDSGTHARRYDDASGFLGGIWVHVMREGLLDEGDKARDIVFGRGSWMHIDLDLLLE